jgi:hypothetical protein
MDHRDDVVDLGMVQERAQGMRKNRPVADQTILLGQAAAGALPAPGRDDHGANQHGDDVRRTWGCSRRGRSAPGLIAPADLSTELRHRCEPPCTVAPPPFPL